jgi:peptide/nickel transport system permease protein
VRLFAGRLAASIATLIAVPSLSFLFWTIQIEGGTWTLPAPPGPSPFERLIDYWESVLLHQDLGRSRSLGEGEVSDIIRAGLPADLSLIIGSLVIGSALGIFAGLMCARSPHAWRSRGARAIALLGLSTPPYTAGLMLLLLFAPLSGHYPIPFVTGQDDYTPLTEDPLGWLQGVWVPWLILAAPVAAGALRMTEVLIREEMTTPLITAARAKGITEREVIRRHALPFAIPAVAALIATSMGVYVFNLALVEQVFNIDGTFRDARRAVTMLDPALVQAYVLVATVLVVLFSLLADMAGAMARRL